MSTEPMVNALVDAVRANDVAAARALIAEHPLLRARIDEPFPMLPFGAKLLNAAIDRGNREMITFLIQSGADVNGRTDWWAGGFGVFEFADGAIVPFLLEQGARMTIHGAARLGLVDEVRRLLREDPSLVHARGGDGKTPLHYAATVEIARLLVEHGAEVDARDVDHESTPAQYLIGDHPDVARWLVEQGAHEDILMAAALGDLPRVRELLDADPAAAEVRVSPAHFPMANPRAGGTIYIWTLGARRSAHGIAYERGYRAVFDLLMERSSPANRLVTACEVGDESLYESLLAAHPEAQRALDEVPRARLVEAAEGNDTRAVRLFLRAGWPVGAVNDIGATALHWAAYNGNAEIARELLRHGAPLDVTERRFGGTPLDWAEHAERTSRPAQAAGAREVARLLRAAASERSPDAASGEPSA